MTRGKNATIGDWLRSSLALRLNLHLLGRLLSAFLSLNIVLLALSLAMILWRAEEGAVPIVCTIGQSQSDGPGFGSGEGGYRVLVSAGPPRGLSLPAAAQRYLPIKEARRSISVPKGRKGTSLLVRLSGAVYTMSLASGGTTYRIVYDLGRDLRRLFYLAALLLAFELLLLIKNIFRGSRAVRRTLRPLAQMAEKARQLNEELSSGRSLPVPEIENLAGVISDIDASRLDQRLPVDEAQNELKELAAAINGMLSRISAAYDSQLRFVSDASHELRTPIAVIQGYANLLDRWGKQDEKTLQESIQAIKSETESMKELVEQLLFLARGDNESLKLHKEEFDCAEMVEEIVAEAQMIRPDHPFDLAAERPAPLVGDKQLLKQAIRILVDNSIKYSPSGHKITVRVAAPGARVLITVQDDGIGIAPEELPNIFDRFYRSDESRARKTGGSGLGLSIAKWIVERHGGHFEVLSRLDVGTRITAVLPCQPPK